MAVKSVTAENLAQFVADKQVLGSKIATHEEVAATDAKAAEGKTPIVGTVTETVSTAPDPGPQDRPAKTDEEVPEGSPKWARETIDRLKREKRELDEIAAGEYEARIQAQRRIAELEAQTQALKPKEQKVEDPEPDPAKYQDQKQFLKEWGEWQRKQAVRDFQAQEDERRRNEEAQRMQAEAAERRSRSIAAAREAHPDFDEKVRQAARAVEAKEAPAPSPALDGLLQESELYAELLYHFIDNPDEVKRLNALRPRQAALAIGRLETKFAKAEKAAEPKPAAVTPTRQVSKAPPPMPSLNGSGSTDTPSDLSEPMDFKHYKTRRIAEIRRKGH